MPQSQKVKKSKSQKVKKSKSRRNTHKKIRRIIKGGLSVEEVKAKESRARQKPCWDRREECIRTKRLSLEKCTDEVEECIELNTSESMPDWVNPE